MKTLLLLISCLSVGVAILHSAVAIEVEYKGGAYPVLAVDGSRPVIEVDGERRTVSDSSLKMRREVGTPFRGGFYGIKNKQIRSQSLSVRRGGKNRNLIFKSEIMTSADIEDAFIVLASAPRDGKSTFFLNELPDL